MYDRLKTTMGTLAWTLLIAGLFVGGAVLFLKLLVGWLVKIA